MPDKSTKHIPKPQEPIGTIKNGKIKVLDGDTQTVRWRQGKTGMSRDYDGDPISTNYNSKDMKSKPSHKVHMGGKRKGHKPKMDERKVSE